MHPYTEVMDRAMQACEGKCPHHKPSMTLLFNGYLLRLFIPSPMEAGVVRDAVASGFRPVDGGWALTTPVTI